ncbi:MAG: tetratricopeptide repeat protein [Methylococcaceae bacterium]|nr:tetratricopeptide repeat protein [Methylococcaceae bacterium]
MELKTDNHRKVPGKLCLLAEWVLLGLLAGYSQSHAGGNPQGTAQPAVTAATGGIAVGGSIFAKAQPGGTAIVNTGNITIGITPEQYEAGLKRREEEIRRERTADKERIAVLEKQLAVIKAQRKNPESALAEYKAKFAEAYRAVDDFKGVIPPEQIQQAQAALAKGESAAAEKLFAEALKRGQENAAEAAYHLGELAYNRIDYAAADDYYRQAVALQPNNPIYLNAAGFIADTIGHYSQAEPLYRRSLAIFEKVLGPDHPYVAKSLNNLAELYRMQGRYAQAAPLFQRSLTIFEKALGPEHPDVATSLNNLAGLYQAQGQYAQAAPLFQRSLAIREKTLGPDHPDIAESLNNLAGLYKALGQYAQAAPLHRRSLAIRVKTLGPDHPDVAESLNNLAGLYKALGQYAQAEPLYQQSLAILEKVLGPNHPDVATSLNNLAELYRMQGQYAQAESLHWRSLGIREKAFSPDHPDIAESFNNLALLYDTQGQYTLAEPLFKRSLAIREKAFGPDHPNVAKSLRNLAELYRQTGRLQEAAALETRIHHQPVQ